MRMVYAACLFAALALGVPSARAQDATAFQLNAAHTGSVSMPGFKPPLKLLWKRTMQGAGISYPLIVDGTVYITKTAYANSDFEGSNLVAFDAATGKPKWWKYINNEQHDTQGDTWANASYDNGQIVVLDRYNVLTSYDAKTGQVKWSQLEGGYDETNFEAPPTASGGSIYMSSFGVNEANGLIKWVGFVHGSGLTSPAVGDGGMYESFVCNYYKFDLSSGAPLWHRDLNCGGGGGTVPQLLGNQLFVRESSRIVPNSILDADTGATLGTFPAIGSNMVPALYDDGAGKHFMVAANGTSLVNYDVTNPASIFSTWSTSLNNEQVTSAPVIVNGYAIAGTVAGGLYVVSPQGGIVWSARLGKPVAPTSERGGPLPMTGLAAGDGIVVVPTEDDNATSQTLFAFAPQ
jgi:hypothetical protein